MWYLHQVNFSFLETFQTSRTNLGQIVSPFQLLATIHLITDTSWFHLILDHLLASMQIFVNMYIYTQGQIIWHHQQCESPQISDILHSTDHSHQYKSTPHTVLHLHGGMQIFIRTSMFEVEASNTIDNVNAKIQGKEGNLTSSPPRVDIPFQQQHQERLSSNRWHCCDLCYNNIYICVMCQLHASCGVSRCHIQLEGTWVNKELTLLPKSMRPSCKSLELDCRCPCISWQHSNIIFLILINW